MHYIYTVEVMQRNVSRGGRLVHRGRSAPIGKIHGNAYDTETDEQFMVKKTTKWVSFS